MDSFGKPWPTWRRHIRSEIGEAPSASSLTEIGRILRPTFFSTKSEVKEATDGQSESSNAGHAWEALVCWYLNLCLAGTRCVVIKKRSQTPEPVKQAITVTYGNTTANSESDLVAVTLPPCELTERDDACASIDHYNPAMQSLLDTAVANQIQETEVCVIQCKTNWNENAQIPMLWDMIYSAEKFVDDRVSVGSGAFGVTSLKSFRYAYATLPTNKIENFKEKSVATLRVRNLSGGNYWGLPSKNGVALELGQIFQRNFKGAIGQGWHANLADIASNLTDKYSYFRL